MDQKHQSIKRFAVEILGCGCPDEVFQTVETGTTTISTLTTFQPDRILIGNRLLIYLAPVDSDTELPILLPDLIKAGTEERDSKGYNRFRLVLYTEDKDFDAAGTDFLFSSLAGVDDRLFLHIIEKQALSDIFEHL